MLFLKYNLCQLHEKLSVRINSNKTNENDVILQFRRLLSEEKTVYFSNRNEKAAAFSRKLYYN